MPRIAIIGAGAFGGWTALQLRRRGADVTLIDAWGPGNSRSSSGGESRVIRAIYGPDRIYVEMVRRAYELWETLDTSADDDELGHARPHALPDALYIETGVLWMHREDDAYTRSSLPILEDLGFPARELMVADAARKYPQIDFRGVRSVYFEQRAGVLSARRACLAVRDAFERVGGTYRTGYVEPGVLADGATTSLRLEDGSPVEADVFVFACGPWLGRLFPEVLGEVIHPTRQEVFYFGCPAGSERYRPGRLPIWIDFGERIFYGTPDVHGRGFKIADDTRGEAVDPTSLDRAPSEEAIARARRLLAERFPELANAPLLESRVCQYANTPDAHLIIDQHPHASHVWLLGGGSGHGFKLAPAVGEMVAEAIVKGKEIPEQFRLARLRIARPSTQFGRR